MEKLGESIFEITLWASRILLVISLITGTIKYKKFNCEQKWFFYYLGFDCILEIVSQLLTIVFQNNLVIYPFYIGGEFLLLSTMIIVGLNLSKKWFIPAGLITGYVLLESFTLWLFNHNIASGIGKTISYLIIVCMVGYYFIHSLSTIGNEKRNPFLAIYGCLFLYYVSAIFIFLVFEHLQTMSIGSASLIFSMNNLLTCVLWSVSSYTFIKL